MRLFAAIKPDSKTLAALALMQEQMKKQGVYGNYTPLSNIHITLSFIGEYGKPEKVLDAMKSVSFCPFELSLNGTGNFGDLYFAKMHVSDNLISYVKELRTAFDSAEIPYDKKKFTPHITLLRRGSKPPVMQNITVKPVTMTADRVYLMRSDRGCAGMIYTPLGYAAAETDD